MGRQSRTVVFPHPDPDKDDIEVRIRGVSAGDSRALLTMDESDADARYEAFLQILAAGILDEDGSQAFHMPGDRKHLEDPAVRDCPAAEPGDPGSLGPERPGAAGDGPGPYASLISHLEGSGLTPFDYALAEHLHLPSAWSRRCTPRGNCAAGCCTSAGARPSAGNGSSRRGSNGICAAAWAAGRRPELTRVPRPARPGHPDPGRRQQLQPTLRDSRRGLGDFGRDVGRIGTLAAGAVAAAGVAAAVAVGAASRKAIDEAVVWQDHLLFLQTLTGPLPTDELADLDAWLKRLGADYGDLGAVADAAYQAMSAGVPFDQLERFLTVAYRQAVGGRAELTDVVDLLTALQNAWADIDIPWEELSDYISLTKDLGKTSVPELAQFAPEGARAAYDQGLAVQEYLAAIAAMSAVLGHTGRSVTQLRALFAEAGKPASEFSKTLATMSGGLSFRELMDEGRTMIDILADMDWYLEHTGRQWAEILASQEAMGAVGILAGDEASLAKSRSILEAFANAEGAADRAFELMDSGWAAWLRRAKGAWQVQTVEFGEDLLAGLEGAVGGLRPGLLPHVRRFRHGPRGPGRPGRGLRRPPGREPDQGHRDRARAGRGHRHNRR